MKIRYSLSHAKGDHKRFMRRLLQIFRAHYFHTNFGEFSNWIEEKLQKYSTHIVMILFIVISVLLLHIIHYL